MRAMVVTGFGGPEVFEQQDVPKPMHGVTEVPVKVHTTRKEGW